MTVDIPDVAAVGGAVASLAFVESGIYTLGGAPTLSRFFVKTSRTGGEKAFIRKGDWTVSGTTLTILHNKNVKQGETILALTPVAATFHLPQDTLSATLKNVSGASCYLRQYIPNDSGHVIDVPGGSLGADVVGQEIEDDDVYCWAAGDFRPGQKYMLVASSAAAAGAILQINSHNV